MRLLNNGSSPARRACPAGRGLAEPSGNRLATGRSLAADYQASCSGRASGQVSPTAMKVSLARWLGDRLSQLLSGGPGAQLPHPSSGRDSIARRL